MVSAVGAKLVTNIIYGMTIVIIKTHPRDGVTVTFDSA